METMSGVLGIFRLGIYFILGIIVLLLLVYFYLMLPKKSNSEKIKFNSENLGSEKDNDNDPIKNL